LRLWSEPGSLNISQAGNIQQHLLQSPASGRLLCAGYLYCCYASPLPALECGISRL